MKVGSTFDLDLIFGWHGIFMGFFEGGCQLTHEAGLCSLHSSLFCTKHTVWKLRTRRITSNAIWQWQLELIASRIMSPKALSFSVYLNVCYSLHIIAIFPSYPYRDVTVKKIIILSSTSFKKYSQLRPSGPVARSSFKGKYSVDIMYRS